MLFVSQGSCDYPSLRLTIEVRQGWEIWHCEYDLQGQSRLPPVAIVVVSVCVVSHALCVNTNKRAFNTCVCLHPTGLRGNSAILHTFVNLGLSASATQKQRMETGPPTHVVRPMSSVLLTSVVSVTAGWIGLTLARLTIVSLRLSLPREMNNSRLSPYDYHHIGSFDRRAGIREYVVRVTMCHP